MQFLQEPKGDYCLVGHLPPNWQKFVIFDPTADATDIHNSFLSYVAHWELST